MPGPDEEKDHAWQGDFMRARLYFSAFLLSGVAIHGIPAMAAPAVLLETTRLVPLDGAPEGGFGRAIAINGDVAVVTANIQSRAWGSGPDLPGAAYVFERESSSGEWLQTAKLRSGFEGDLYGIDVAVDGNVIAVGAVFSGLTYVYEKHAGTWQLMGTLGGPSGGNGHSVAIENAYIAIGDDSPHGMAIYRRGASAWVQIARYENGVGLSDDEYFSPQVDISQNFAIHGSAGFDSAPPVPSTAYIYRPADGGNVNWHTPVVTALTRPGSDGTPDGFSSRVAIAANTALIDDWLYQSNASGQWTNTAHIPGAVALDDDETRVLGRSPPFRNAPLYKRNSAGSWPLSAELVTSDARSFSSVTVDSGRVLSGFYPNNFAYVYELPENLARPALSQDNFQDGDAAGWATTPGSLFAVASNGTFRFYRQNSAAGNSAALWQGQVGNDQSIQADITPRAFNGSDRWFGLVTRYTDINNYYYVTARSGGGVQLKRMLGGVFTTLGSAALPVAIGTTNRIRLEAAADHVRVFVNENVVIRVRDSSLSGGRPGLMTYQARVDFDNVVVNANPAFLAFADGFGGLDLWESRAGEWPIVNVNGSYVRRQSDVTGGTRLVIYGAGFGNYGTAGDQVVQADLRPTQFSGTDRWVGLMARYRNDTNYYYVTLRNSGSIDIRKLVDGSINTLASVPFTVQPNVTYRVRFETVGTSLRVFVNGTLRAEATDGSLTPFVSSAGVATFKAAVDVDNVSVMQP